MNDSEIVFSITVGDVRKMAEKDGYTLTDHDIWRLRYSLPDNFTLEKVEDVVFFACTNDEFGWEGTGEYDGPCPDHGFYPTDEGCTACAERASTHE